MQKLSFKLNMYEEKQKRETLIESISYQLELSVVNQTKILFGCETNKANCLGVKWTFSLKRSLGELQIVIVTWCQVQVTCSCSPIGVFSMRVSDPRFQISVWGLKLVPTGFTENQENQ
jgi:hypothetical protein